MKKDTTLQQVIGAAGKLQRPMDWDQMREIAWEDAHEDARSALLGLAALGKKIGITGPKDASTNLDDYLYGDKEIPDDHG